MKKLSIGLMLFALSIVSAKSYAQEKTSFGVKAGSNFSGFVGNGKGKDLKYGFQVGATVERDINACNFYSRYGLDLTTKGAEQKIGSTTVTSNPVYLQLPLMLGHKYKISENINLLTEMGFYYAVGLFGKTKVKGADIADSDFFGSKKDNGARRYDFGLSGAVGVEFGKIVVRCGYDIGIMDFSRSENTEIQNSCVSLTVGYKF